MQVLQDEQVTRDNKELTEVLVVKDLKVSLLSSLVETLGRKVNM